MRGPFRTGDLVVQRFGKVTAASFVFGPSGIYMPARWQAAVPTPVNDAVIEFREKGGG